MIADMKDSNFNRLKAITPTSPSGVVLNSDSSRLALLCLGNYSLQIDDLCGACHTRLCRTA
eukprot:SAG11_NODE_33322_length_278_cov_0.569832_1_plen_60_part_01